MTTPPKNYSALLVTLIAATLSFCVMAAFGGTQWEQFQDSQAKIAEANELATQEARDATEMARTAKAQAAESAAFLGSLHASETAAAGEAAPATAIPTASEPPPQGTSEGEESDPAVTPEPDSDAIPGLSLIACQWNSD